MSSLREMARNLVFSPNPGAIRFRAQEEGEISVPIIEVGQAFFVSWNYSRKVWSTKSTPPPDDRLVWVIQQMDRSLKEACRRDGFGPPQHVEFLRPDRLHYRYKPGIKHGLKTRFQRVQVTGETLGVRGYALDLRALPEES